MHEQLSIVPEKALKRFPVGGTWTGRLTAALCIQSGYCVSRWFSTQWASVCAGSAGLQRQLCARRPLDVCPQPQRADPLPWEASPAPVDRSVSLSLSHGKFCLPELVWDRARGQLSQGLAHSRCGELHMSGHFFKLLWGANEISGSVSCSSCPLMPQGEIGSTGLLLSRQKTEASQAEGSSAAWRAWRFCIHDDVSNSPQGS